MRTTTAICACLLLVGCSTEPTSMLTAVDAEPAFATGDVPVTSELVDGSSSPRNIQSDGLGPYRNGVNGVTSILQGVGDWELDLTGRKSTRKMRLDLTDPVTGNPGAAPFTIATVAARVIARPTQLGATFQGMTGLGSTMLSPLSIAQFKVGSKTYAIRMNRNNHPQTDWVQVTCVRVVDPNAPATSPCSAWRLTPTGTYDGMAKNVGYVEQVGTSGSTFVGLYYFTFDFLVSR